MTRMVAALLLVAACGVEPGTPANPVQDVDWAGQVEEITLSDGTRCAVFTGPNGMGGIDCDWRQG